MQLKSRLVSVKLLVFEFSCCKDTFISENLEPGVVYRANADVSLVVANVLFLLKSISLLEMCLHLQAKFELGHSVLACSRLLIGLW